MLVADASALVKVLTREEGTDAAREVLTSAGIVAAPDFVTIEVASALSKKVRYHGLPRGQALASLDALPHFVSDFVPFDDLVQSGFDLSLHLKHAMQDCLYLALAIDRGCQLVTGDRKFANRAQAIGMEEHLHVLGDHT